MIAMLSGYRTYLFTAAWMVVSILEHAGVLGRVDPALAMTHALEAALLGAAGLSLRAAVQKAQDAAQESA